MHMFPKKEISPEAQCAVGPLRSEDPPPRNDAQHPIENPDLLGSVILGAQARLSPDFKVLGELVFVPVKVFPETHGGTVVAMYDYGNTTLDVVKTARW